MVSVCFWSLTDEQREKLVEYAGLVYGEEWHHQYQYHPHDYPELRDGFVGENGFDYKKKQEK